MLVKTYGSAVYGVDAITITVEVNVMKGKELLHCRPAGQCDQGKSSAYRKCIEDKWFSDAEDQILVNLAPANIRKSGSAFDLPIAIGILAGSGQIKNLTALKQIVIMGELNLDGSILPVKGALPMAIQARKEKFRGFIVPQSNGREAAMVNQLAVYPVSHIREVVEFLDDRKSIDPLDPDTRMDFFSTQYPVRY